MTDYAKLSEGEKWAWHAEVYAFRRIALNVPVEEKISPCDTDGKWYNEDMIRAAAARLQAKRQEAYRRRESALSAEMIGEGRVACNKWARECGYADFAAAEADGKTHADVIRTIGAKAMPIAVRHTNGTAAAEMLGAVATEWKPTAEQLAAGLAELQDRGYLPTSDQTARGLSELQKRGDIEA